jgi:hypothetical protein
VDNNFFKKRSLKPLKWVGFLLVFGNIFAACETDNSKIIQEQVAARVKKFTADKTAEHQLRLLEMASLKVDSFLLNEARQNLRDSLGNIRPIKPGQLELIPPIDSATVKPLF